jgi:hypothetical protein
MAAQLDQQLAAAPRSSSARTAAGQREQSARRRFVCGKTVIGLSATDGYTESFCRPAGPTSLAPP